jgi:hypothetical protein
LGVQYRQPRNRDASARAGIEFERVLESIPVGIEFASGAPVGAARDHFNYQLGDSDE